MEKLHDCKVCEFTKFNEEEGHCYMFREEPAETCGKFTPTKLENGCIPANTECPFKGECDIRAVCMCAHGGLGHKVAFSCAAARFYDMMEQRKG